MNTNRIEAELLKSLLKQNSWEDVLLTSQGSLEQTNLILMKIINRQHMHSVRKPSNSYQNLTISAAA